MTESYCVRALLPYFFIGLLFFPVLIGRFFLCVSFFQLGMFTRRSPYGVRRFDDVRVRVGNRWLVDMVFDGYRDAFVVVDRIGAVFRLDLNVNNVDVRACDDVRRLEVVLANFLAARRLFRAERQARQIRSGLASVAVTARRRLAFDSVAHVVEGDIHGVATARNDCHGGDS